MDLTHRQMRAGAVPIAVIALALAAGAGTFSAPSAAASAAAPRFTAITGSLPDIEATQAGAYRSARMSVEVVLAPRNRAQLNAELAAVYQPGGPDFQHWLAKGQFDARYAPSATARGSVAGYLRASGLTVTGSASPFLVRAFGPSQRVAAAFHTSLTSYRGGFFANSASVRLPSALAPGVLGVVGLTNTVRLHPQVMPPRTGAARGSAARAGAASAGAVRAAASCERPYPSRAKLIRTQGIGLSPYAGGPGCSGLTPSQLNSIYGAPHAGARAKGAGVDLAVFEESGYQESDIATWARTFYGRGFHPPLVNIDVDGGPLHPACPAGDKCPAFLNGYSVDIEVDADIETQLAVAPDASHILVYNAPGDETGQTSLDEFTRMAADDTAAVVNSSYGECENMVGAAYAQAENTIFEQMALQGQSMFSASGDSGAFDCLDTDGRKLLNVDDPPTQPWVTSVGGTSLESDNPGFNSHPAYPAGVETVWNPGNLCNGRKDEGGQTGFFWCGRTGAGGGGSSQFWGMPFYQRGPGIISKYTGYGNGSTHCSLAALGTPCREVPDVSANADQFTGYAEFCTGTAKTRNSVCAEIDSKPHGWFAIGGTSLSSPLWSAIIADRDSFTGHRTGNINPLMYLLYNLAPQHYFHDITGTGPAQSAAINNGHYPTTPGFDLATGIGTPTMAPLITQTPF